MSSQSDITYKEMHARAQALAAEELIASLDKKAEWFALTNKHMETMKRGTDMPSTTSTASTHEVQTPSCVLVKQTSTPVRSHWVATGTSIRANCRGGASATDAVNQQPQSDKYHETAAYRSGQRSYSPARATKQFGKGGNGKAAPHIDRGSADVHQGNSDDSNSESIPMRAPQFYKLARTVHTALMVLANNNGVNFFIAKPFTNADNVFLMACSFKETYYRATLRLTADGDNRTFQLFNQKTMETLSDVHIFTVQELRMCVDQVCAQLWGKLMKYSAEYASTHRKKPQADLQIQLQSGNSAPTAPASSTSSTASTPIQNEPTDQVAPEPQAQMAEADEKKETDQDAADQRSLEERIVGMATDAQVAQEPQTLSAPDAAAAAALTARIDAIVMDVTSAPVEEAAPTEPNPDASVSVQAPNEQIPSAPVGTSEPPQASSSVVIAADINQPTAVGATPVDQMDGPEMCE